MGRHFGEKWAIYVASASGDNVARLSSDKGGAGDPDWSPDGKRVVYGNVAEPPEASALHILDLATYKESIIPGSSGYFSPRWSPDGRLLAAVRMRDYQIIVFDFRRERWQKLSDIPGAYPNWSANSQSVYFSAHVGPRAIYRANALTGHTEQVADLARVQQGSFIFGTWIGLAPDDSPIVVQNLTTEDIFSSDFEAK